MQKCPAWLQLDDERRFAVLTTFIGTTAPPTIPHPTTPHRALRIHHVPPFAPPALTHTLLGTGLFAYITGEVTALATTRLASAQALQKKLEAIKEFFRHHKLPRVLFKQV